MGEKWLSLSARVRSNLWIGEQSVGKSFALNHLVDTSFAGSAMRTTEGVWMSVTPTDNSLIVALDFEGEILSNCLHRDVLIHIMIGVHSIERSAQEDSLLVLFNTAISNLVSQPPRNHLRVDKYYTINRSFSATTLRYQETSPDYFNPSSPLPPSLTLPQILPCSNQRWL